MFTLQEIELLAGLLSRAGVTQIEALFANSLLERLRAAAQGLAEAASVDSRESEANQAERHPTIK